MKRKILISFLCAVFCLTQNLPVFAQDPVATNKELVGLEQLATDITTAKDAIKSYQNNEKDLTNMIRDLITENDALYTSLSKRSREVAELRAKFYGIPYNQAYNKAMTDMPPDRVPQRLHPDDDTLPVPVPMIDLETPTIVTNDPVSGKNRQEIDDLIADIAILHQAKNTSRNPQALADKKAEASLQAKKEMLLLEIQTLSEKQERLTEKQKSTEVKIKEKVDNLQDLEAPKKTAESHPAKAVPAPKKEPESRTSKTVPSSRKEPESRTTQAIPTPKKTAEVQPVKVPRPTKKAIETLQVRKNTLVKKVATLSEKQKSLIREQTPAVKIAEAKHNSNDTVGSLLQAKKDRLIQEIRKISEEQLIITARQNAGSHQTVVAPIPSQKEPARSLQAKKDLLTEKTKSLAEKQHSLVALKQELTTINKGLKNANNRYLEAINKIDNYYRDIKGEVSGKNYVRQTMFANLLKDYTQKTKEANMIWSAVRSRDKTLQQFKMKLAEQNTRIKNIDDNMLAMDIQLGTYKAMLTQYRNELERRATLIRDQKKLLDMTDQKLTEASTKVSVIEKTLEESNAALTRMPTGIDRIRQMLIRKDKAIKKINETINLRQEHNTGKINTLKDQVFVQTAHAEKLVAENAEITGRLDTSRKELETANERIRFLERSLENMVIRLKANRIPVAAPSTKDLDDKIMDLEAKLDRKEVQLEEARTRIFDLTHQPNTPAPVIKPTAPLSPAAEDALARARITVAELTAKLESNLAEIGRLKELLGIKEKEYPQTKKPSGQVAQKP